MANKSMDDLFARLRPAADGEQRPQEKAPIHQNHEERVNATRQADAFLGMTVDQWMEAEGMHTIELSSSRGKFYMTKSKKAHKRLVKAGEVVFSPLEVERFIILKLKDSSAINEKLIDSIYQLKKMDPGAKLYEVQLDQVEAWPQEEPADAAWPS